MRRLFRTLPTEQPLNSPPFPYDKHSIEYKEFVEEVERRAERKLEVINRAIDRAAAEKLGRLWCKLGVGPVINEMEYDALKDFVKYGMKDEEIDHYLHHSGVFDLFIPDVAD